MLMYSPGQDAADGCGLNLEARLTGWSWGCTVRAVIDEFTPGEAILRTEDRIPEGTAVRVNVEDFGFDGDILYCRPRGDHYTTHISIDDVDEKGFRTAPRFPVNLWARIFASVLEVPVEGIIVDLSGDGIGLELPRELPPESTIAIESELNIALGVVRYQREISPGRFRTGVRLWHVLGKNTGNNSREPGFINKLTKRLSHCRIGVERRFEAAGLRARKIAAQRRSFVR
jgi:hypothetical protein